MYFLWEHDKIQKPSDYWNMSMGDKIVSRAFYEHYNEERLDRINNIKNIFPVMPI